MPLQIDQQRAEDASTLERKIIQRDSQRAPGVPQRFFGYNRLYYKSIYALAPADELAARHKASRRTCAYIGLSGFPSRKENGLLSSRAPRERNRTIERSS
jgi:hypothetical protein